jgi:hypothetical protein
MCHVFADTCNVFADMCHVFADMCRFLLSGLVLLTGLWNGPVIGRFRIGASSIQILETEDYSAEYI